MRRLVATHPVASFCLATALLAALLLITALVNGDGPDGPPGRTPYDACAIYAGDDLATQQCIMSLLP